MKGYVLSLAAQRDLDDIWDYSAETWSPAQANRYVEHIRDACEMRHCGVNARRTSTARPPGCLRTRQFSR